MSHLQWINWATEISKCEKLFPNKDIHFQVELFNETILNIVQAYILNEYTTYNDKDLPYLNDH